VLLKQQILPRVAAVWNLIFVRSTPVYEWNCVGTRKSNETGVHNRIYSRVLVNVCGKGSTSEPVCCLCVCETGGEPVLPLWLKWEAKINMGADALEWKRSKCDFMFSILFKDLFFSWVKPRPVSSRELIPWTCTSVTYGWCIVRRHVRYCLNRVSALKTIQVTLSYCGEQTGEICLLQNSECAAWKGHTDIAVPESSCEQSVCSDMKLHLLQVFRTSVHFAPHYANISVHLTFIHI
jgi:hypothetical protein